MNNEETPQLNIMFDEYLRKVDLSIEDMSETQYNETRRAFMAGISSPHVYLIIGVPPYYAVRPDLWEKRADSITNELKSFWEDENKK